MKPTLLLGCALLAGSTLHAQLSFLPYAGIEQSRNTLSFGNGFSAPDVNGFFKAGLRTDYRFRTGHSPFVNLTTSPAVSTFAFDKTGSLLSQSQAGGLLFRLEAGYQYSSKPIQFGKKTSPQRSYTQNKERTDVQKSRCGSTTYRSSCVTKKTALTSAPTRNLNMRLQPSLALAYVPSATTGVAETVNGFTYTSGWKTAIVPAMGFEFAKGAQRLFTLGVFYTAPIRQKTETVKTAVESKVVTTTLQPQLSTWGLTMGVPFNFTKAKTTATKAKGEKRSCTRTHYRTYSQLQ